MAELPRVKVCGLTRAEDVRVALRAGAEALGFVHYAPSPRDVDAGRVARIVAEVPADVPTVAVLVDTTPADARAYLASSGLRWVQLCGSEDADAWRGFEAPILRRVAVDEGAGAEVARWMGIARAFVLDHPAAPGGTGASVELARAAEIAASAPCLLAGGMAPENVAARVRAVEPWGVDASSRLESAPGIKDPARVAAFVAAARASLAERTP